MSFKGTSIEQDARYSNKMKKFKNTLSFSRVLKKKIDFSKVKLFVIKEWISKRIVELMEFEDEIVVNYVFEMLEEKENVDPKEMQIYLTGFMEENARLFMKELWKLLNEAQKSESGIPKRFIEEEKQRIKKEEEMKKIISEKIIEKSKLNADLNNSCRNDEIPELKIRYENNEYEEKRSSSRRKRREKKRLSRSPSYSDDDDDYEYEHKKRSRRKRYYEEDYEYDEDNYRKRKFRRLSRSRSKSPIENYDRYNKRYD